MSSDRQSSNEKLSFQFSIQTPLHLAMHLGHMEMSSFLISKGSDLHAKDSNGQTPLFMAIWSEFPDCAEVLLAPPNSVSVNIKDHDGDTPLCYAVSNDYKSCYALLIEYGADDGSLYIDEGTMTIHNKAIEKWGEEFVVSVTKKAKLKWELRKLEAIEYVLTSLVASIGRGRKLSETGWIAMDCDGGNLLTLAEEHILDFPPMFETLIMDFLFLKYKGV